MFTGVLALVSQYEGHIASYIGSPLVCVPFDTVGEITGRTSPQKYCYHLDPKKKTRAPADPGHVESGC